MAKIAGGKEQNFSLSHHDHAVSIPVVVKIAPACKVCGGIFMNERDKREIEKIPKLLTLDH